MGDVQISASFVGGGGAVAPAFLDTPVIETLPYWSTAFYADVAAVSRTNSTSSKPRCIPVRMQGGFRATKVTLFSGSVGSSGLTHSWVNVFVIAPGSTTAAVVKVQSLDVTGEWAANTSRDFYICQAGGNTVAKPWVAETEMDYIFEFGVVAATTVPTFSGITWSTTFGAPPPNNGLNTASFTGPVTTSIQFSNITADLIMPRMVIS